MSWVAFILAILSGAATTVQAGSNSQLKESLGDPKAALLINYIIGLIGIVAFIAFVGMPRPGASTMANTPWWAWTGGLLGIGYGLAVVLLAHRLGAATLVSAVVTGQLICSVLLDHFGWMGFDNHTASPLRITGCGLMIAGFILIAKF